MATFLGQKMITKNWVYGDLLDVLNTGHITSGYITTLEYRAREHIRKFRDDIRTSLMPGAGNSNTGGSPPVNRNWVVSEIGRWVGSSSNHIGYAFIVRQMDGDDVSPAPTGVEFLIMFGSPLNNQDMYLYSFGNIFNGSPSTYFRSFGRYSSDTLDNGTGSGQGMTPFLIHFNNTGGLGTGDEYDMGFTNFAEGRYAGNIFGQGDFTDIDVSGTSPYADIATFMGPASSSEVKGISADDLLIKRFYYHSLALIFDDSLSHPCCSLYATEGQNIARIYFACLGNIITPRVGTDVFKQGCFTSEISSALATDYGVRGNSYLQGRYSGGVRTSFTLYTQTPFTEFNSPPSRSSSYPWAPVVVGNSTQLKGQLNSELFRVIGPVDRHPHRLYKTANNNTIFKREDTIAYPYAPNEPPFPTYTGHF